VTKVNGSARLIVAPSARGARAGAERREGGAPPVDAPGLRGRAERRAARPGERIGRVGAAREGGERVAQRGGQRGRLADRLHAQERERADGRLALGGHTACGELRDRTVERRGARARRGGHRRTPRALGRPQGVGLDPARQTHAGEVEHHRWRAPAQVHALGGARALQRGDGAAHGGDGRARFGDLERAPGVPHVVVGLEERRVDGDHGRLSLALPRSACLTAGGPAGGTAGRGEQLLGGELRQRLVLAVRVAVAGEVGVLRAALVVAQAAEDDVAHATTDARLVGGDAARLRHHGLACERRAARRRAAYERLGELEEHALAERRRVGACGGRGLDGDRVVLAGARDAQRARLGDATPRVAQAPVAGDRAQVHDVARLEGERGQAQLPAEHGAPRPAQRPLADPPRAESEALPLARADDVLEGTVRQPEVVVDARGQRERAGRRAQHAVDTRACERDAWRHVGLRLDDEQPRAPAGRDETEHPGALRDGERRLPPWSGAVTDRSHGNRARRAHRRRRGSGRGRAYSSWSRSWSRAAGARHPRSRSGTAVPWMRPGRPRRARRARATPP
jgi:hypothetical protein